MPVSRRAVATVQKPTIKVAIANGASGYSRGCYAALRGVCLNNGYDVFAVHIAIWYNYPRSLWGLLSPFGEKGDDV